MGDKKCVYLMKVKKGLATFWQWVKNNFFGLIFAVCSIAIIFAVKWIGEWWTAKIILITLTVVLAIVLHLFFKDRLKKQKRGHILFAFFLFLWVTFLTVPWLGLILKMDVPHSSSAFISINKENNSDNEEFVLRMSNVRLLSWTSGIENSSAQIEGSRDENDLNQEKTGSIGNINDQIYLFNQYSWYISLIITILGAIAGVIMYYNWRSNQKIKEEWEKLSKETLKEETEINEAFYKIRSEVLNDPRLGNGKDKENLEKFANKFREGYINVALKYAFAAREIQPDIKQNGKYNQEEINNWEAACQYWKLAADYLPDKDAYDKEHKGFIYNGLGNALKELANYGRNIFDETRACQDQDRISKVVKEILLYYGNALAAYEMVLAIDNTNNVVINNKANLLIDVYRFKEGSSYYIANDKFFNYWRQSVAKSPILWEDIIKGQVDYFSSNGLLHESYSLMEKMIKKDGLSGLDYTLRRDVWYYRNYAIACYLKTRYENPENYENDNELYEEFIDYLRKYAYRHKDGKFAATLDLEKDEDLKKYKAFKEKQVDDLLKELKCGK